MFIYNELLIFSALVGIYIYVLSNICVSTFDKDIITNDPLNI